MSIDRDALIAVLDAHLVDGDVQNSSSQVADEVLGLVVADPRVNIIRQLHQSSEFTDQQNHYWCVQCGRRWPCPTVRILDS